MQRKILVIGAGRSSTSLIQYLLNNAEKESWEILITDIDQKLVEEKIGGNRFGKFFKFNALNHDERMRVFPELDIIISMLPARFHPEVIKDCIACGKNVITPSYISEEVKELDQAAKDAGVIVLNEVGLDPGIDHMSALKVIDDVKARGGKITRFESFTGGLIAPESDNNPWNYKFTWNPRNVVLAGQGGPAQFLQYGKYKYVPYHKLFTRTLPIHIDGYGNFEGYPNRDSLSYKEVYGLEDIATIYRGTLRRSGYSEAWNVFVQLGMTDDTYTMDDLENLTFREYTNSFLPYHKNKTVENKLKESMDVSDIVMNKLQWLGIFSDEKVNMKDATPAQVLQKILEKKWTLAPDDKDMIVMWHRFDYELDGEKFEQISSMVVVGDDEDNTGMAKTVGIPVGIACKLILNGTIVRKGVCLPKYAEMYLPILKELEDYGINFKEDIKVMA